MPRPALPEGYSRRHRFTHRGAFSPALRGMRKVRGRLAVLHAVPAPATISRFGIALTKRHVPHSSDRNQLKRIAREVFRRHRAKREGFDCVLTLRGPVSTAERPGFAIEVAGLLDRLTDASRKP